MLIVNARLYTMAGTYIENGYLRTEGTVIAELGPMPADAKPNEEVIDAQGAALYPGFVDAHTHLGMTEMKKPIQLPLSFVQSMQSTRWTAVFVKRWEQVLPLW